MAITMAIDPLKMLAKAGYDVSVLQNAQLASQIKVVSTLASIKIVSVMSGEVLGSIKLTPSELNELAAQKAVINAVKVPLALMSEVVKAHLESLPPSTAVVDEASGLMYASQVTPGVAPSPALSVLPDGAYFAGGQITGSITGGSTFESVPKTKPTSTYPVVEKPTDAPSVPLKKAKALYQPVTGTSPNSRYFMVADFDTLKMAVRVVDGGMSVRFESSNFSKDAKMLVHLGVDVKDGYASLHLQVPDLLTAQKVVGAFILSANIQLVSPLPDLSRIMGLK